MDSGCKQTRYVRRHVKGHSLLVIVTADGVVINASIRGGLAMERRDIVHSEQAFNRNIETMQNGSAGVEPVSVVGQVKWFDFTKGYGFISTFGMGDVLLHHKCLRRSGFSHVAEGATVRCEAVKGPSGLQAVRILSVDNSTIPSKDRQVTPLVQSDE